MVQEIEGVIKYHGHHTHCSSHLTHDDINLINHWRNLLHSLQLIGQHPSRYAGYGYGNISQRHAHHFIISGSQTGHLATLTPQHYCLVTDSDLTANSLNSIGACKPSSEALTHASVYAQNPNINCVIHAHNPDIWQATHRLKLPFTDKEIAYGTPEMATAVSQLFSDHAFTSNEIFTMRGHEDGVIAYGTNFSDAFHLLINTLINSQLITAVSTNHRA